MLLITWESGTQASNRISGKSRPIILRDNFIVTFGLYFGSYPCRIILIPFCSFISSPNNNSWVSITRRRCLGPEDTAVSKTDPSGVSRVSPSSGKGGNGNITKQGEFIKKVKWCEVKKAWLLRPGLTIHFILCVKNYRKGANIHLSVTVYIS